MNDFISKQMNGSQSIRFPQCPRCNIPIRHCQRYTSITNRIQIWIEKIKNIQQNGFTKEKVNEERIELSKTIKNSFEIIKSIESKCFDNFIRRLDNKKQSINIDEINYFKNSLQFFTEIK